MEAVKHPKNMKVVLDNESRHSLSYTSRNDKNKKVNDKNKKVNVKKKIISTPKMFGDSTSTILVNITIYI